MNPNHVAEAFEAQTVNSAGIGYGGWRTGDDVPAQVAEAVNCEMIDDDIESGTVEVGGMTWRYRSL